MVAVIGGQGGTERCSLIVPYVLSRREMQAPKISGSGLDPARGDELRLSLSLASHKPDREVRTTNATVSPLSLIDIGGESRPEGDLRDGGRPFRFRSYP